MPQRRNVNKRNSAKGAATSSLGTASKSKRGSTKTTTSPASLSKSPAATRASLKNIPARVNSGLRANKSTSATTTSSGLMNKAAKAPLTNNYVVQNRILKPGAIKIKTQIASTTGKTVNKSSPIVANTKTVPQRTTNAFKPSENTKTVPQRTTNAFKPSGSKIAPTQTLKKPTTTLRQASPQQQQNTKKNLNNRNSPSPKRSPTAQPNRTITKIAPAKVENKAVNKTVIKATNKIVNKTVKKPENKPQNKTKETKTVPVQRKVNSQSTNILQQKKKFDIIEISKKTEIERASDAWNEARSHMINNHFVPLWREVLSKNWRPIKHGTEMKRPISIFPNQDKTVNAYKKYFLEDNENFLVIAVVGTKGVGKSTILNMLAKDTFNNGFYKEIFRYDMGIFPTKTQKKVFGAPHKDAFQFYITKDRKILIDTPPLCNSAYTRRKTEDELLDLYHMLTLMATCHIVIVVQDVFLDFELLRILKLAEHLNFPLDNENCEKPTYPNLLFIKNMCPMGEFNNIKLNSKINELYYKAMRNTSCRIFRGQKVNHNGKNIPIGNMGVFNSVFIPKITGPEGTDVHFSLKFLVNHLKHVIALTPQNSFIKDKSFNELRWFEYFNDVISKNYFYIFQMFKKARNGEMEALQEELKRRKKRFDEKRIAAMEAAKEKTSDDNQDSNWENAILQN